MLILEMSNRHLEREGCAVELPHDVYMDFVVALRAYADEFEKLSLQVGE
jgi:hypothetical protein